MAFTNRDDGLRLIKARLHYVELAENLSYHIPHFRHTYDFFPREIYFCATTDEVKTDEEKTRAGDEGETKISAAVEALETQVQDLKQQLMSQQKREEDRFHELKSLLLGHAENSKAESRAEQ